MPSEWPRLRPRLLVERLEARAVPTFLAVGPNYNVAQPSDLLNQSECTIAINPIYSGAENLFAACNPDYYRYSLDGGATWERSNLNGLPPLGGDNQAAFDTFGNLFVTYTRLGATAVHVIYSVDDGATFRLLATFTGGVDQPSIAIGPGGQYAEASVWVSFQLNSAIRAAGAPINGWDDVGSFSAPQLASLGNFGDVSVGPNGAVSITYQNPVAGAGPSNVIVRNDPDGLGPLGFGPIIIASSTNVGGFTPIPAQPGRTIAAEANLAYDWSPFSSYAGRLYLVYVNRPTLLSADTEIVLRVSDDYGENWSAPVLLNDDGSGRSQFNPAIAVDPVTGWIAVTWYDARQSALNNRAEIWGTVSLDGGTTWEPNVQIGAALNCGLCAGIFNFGDYDTMDFAWGVFYRIWADNTDPSQLIPVNLSLIFQDPGIARVEVYPDEGPGPQWGPGWFAKAAPALDGLALEALNRRRVVAAEVSQHQLPARSAGDGNSFTVVGAL